jgi:hypothetical protein
MGILGRPFGWVRGDDPQLGRIDQSLLERLFRIPVVPADQQAIALGDSVVGDQAITVSV